MVCFIDGANLLRGRARASASTSTQEAPAHLCGQRKSGPRLYLHRTDRRPGVLADAAARDWLDYNGYTMVPSRRRIHGRLGRRKIKATWNIELAIDVMEMPKRLDHVVLFSGDGDFRRLVEAVPAQGRGVTVVSTIRSSPPMVARRLRRQKPTSSSSWTTSPTASPACISTRSRDRWERQRR